MMGLRHAIVLVADLTNLEFVAIKGSIPGKPSLFLLRLVARCQSDCLFCSSFKTQVFATDFDHNLIAVSDFEEIEVGRVRRAFRNVNTISFEASILAFHTKLAFETFFLPIVSLLPV
jgi:hypothetical protein